jgi:glycine cleavage system H protein
MNVPKELKYSKEHEWVNVEGETATVGISDYAQDALGDVVFVDLPAEGAAFAKGDEVLTIESTKAAASIYAPGSGSISGVNSALADDPGLVNSDCYWKGWIYKMKLDDPGELDELMDAEAYEQFLGTLED